MANRRLQNIQFSYQRIPIHAWATVTFGSTGAPTLTANPAISTVVRNSAGDYTFTFKDRFNKGAMSVDHQFKNTTAPAAPGMFIKSDLSASATKTIEIVFNSAGTPTDPGSGEVVLMHFVFNDQSTTY